MPNDRPDPSDFIAQAQKMMRQLLGDQPRDDSDPWAGATRAVREPSPGQQRENLTFALATRAVEALEDLALNVAAIRQRLERSSNAPPERNEDRSADAPPGH